MLANVIDGDPPHAREYAPVPLLDMGKLSRSSGICRGPAQWSRAATGGRPYIGVGSPSSPGPLVPWSPRPLVPSSLGPFVFRPLVPDHPSGGHGG
jgi:hypothetical protein